MAAAMHLVPNLSTRFLYPSPLHGVVVILHFKFVKFQQFSHLKKQIMCAIKI